MAIPSTTFGGVLSRLLMTVKSPPRSFNFNPWDEGVADVMAALPSPSRVRRVARCKGGIERYIDIEAHGSGSDSSGPYLYEGDSDGSLVEEL